MTAAKLELAGEVGIDLPAGPSEGMVLADAAADARRVAADLITQAEHGPDSPALLVTTDAAFADAVEAEVGGLLATAPRRDILARALARPRPDRPRRRPRRRRSTFVNAYAPGAPLGRRRGRSRRPSRAIRNAGSIFVGPWAPGIGRRLRDRARTTSCRPAAWPAAAAAGRRDVRQVHPGPADHARGPRRAPRHDPDAGRGRGAARPPRRRRDPVRATTRPTRRVR